jgi:hypothetical protein
MANLFAKELGEAEILSRSVLVEEQETEDGPALVLIWQMTCVEDIAAETPIGVE